MTLQLQSGDSTDRQEGVVVSQVEREGIELAATQVGNLSYSNEKSEARACEAPSEASSSTQPQGASEKCLNVFGFLRGRDPRGIILPRRHQDLLETWDFVSMFHKSYLINYWTTTAVHEEQFTRTASCKDGVQNSKCMHV
ncbi:hypothetical protein K2173_018265 [Erythroxylum novogranatense]|uniref:Uncharacterized protein n=1 Tax=Erythroxylum novogranatense TaxID=1862640 RepID=A0AAV8UEN7_9ROSI|nr:hypothetical protein K2173_018265 [Erythroxylum novogranatense]